MMDDLVAFLRARYDDTARKARAAIEDEFLACGQWLAQGPYGDQNELGHIQSEQHEQVIDADLPWPVAQHVAENDPARVLREVEAKRRLVALHTPVTLRRRVGDQMGDVVACEYDTDPDGMGWIDHPCETLRLLALPYADHPDYREEWRP